MYSLFTRLINMSLVAGIVVLAVLGLRLCLKKAPKRFVCLLWAVVAIRLIIPFSVDSNFSVFNIIDLDTAGSGRIEYFQYNGKTEKPEITFSIPDITINFKSIDESKTLVPEQKYTYDPEVYLPPLIKFWGFGVFAMLASAGVSYFRLRKKTAAALMTAEKVFICDDIDSPFILGIFRPHIYIPSGMKEPAKASVIAHEQAHIKRLDQLWKPLGYALLSIHWFNPLIWLAYALLCRDIEAACDEKVIKNMDNSGITAYSQALLSCAVHRRLITACPVAFGETDVKARVENVLNYKKPARWIVCIAATACVIAGFCLLTDPAAAAQPAQVNGEEIYALENAEPNPADEEKKIDEKADTESEAEKAPAWNAEESPADEAQAAIENAAATPASESKNAEAAATQEAIFWTWPCESTEISASFWDQIRSNKPDPSILYHINIAGEKGSPIYAAASGEVIKAEYEAARGNYVEMKHPGEYISQYWHLDEIYVSVGDQVEAGDIIGTMGASGMATGPNLGLCIVQDGELIDPATLFDVQSEY